MVVSHCIRVLGRELQVKSTSTPEHVAQVESLVNEKLAEATEAVSSGDHQLVVILTLMNLAEAYLASQKQLEEERLSCRERISSLIGRVDNAV